MIEALILLGGFLLGGFIIGGLFFAIFSNSAIGPNRNEEALYTWIGRIIGVVIAIIIISNL